MKHLLRFTRFPVLRRGLLTLATTTLVAGSLAAQTRHLFLDPAFVRETQNVALTVTPAQRREVVIQRDRPWESFMITFYLSVIDEGAKLRMWYDTRESTTISHLAYAESTDGVRWTKPELGLAEHHGNKATNLVGISSLEGNVFRDPHAANETERYVYVTTVFKGGGIYRFTSPDGLRWKRDGQPLMPFEADSQNITFWDERLGRYILFFRGWDRDDPRNQWRRLVRLEADRLDRPLPLVPTGKGRHASDPARDPLITTEAPTVLTCDARDPEHTDIYTSAIQRYPLAPEWYVGFPSFYHHATNTRNRNDGRTETQFIASRDGMKWERYSRAPYIRPGLAGSDSANMVYVGWGMVLRGDEIWHYATGYRTTHGDTPGRQKQADGVIHRYVQRVDGFVSLDFNDTPGSATTSPVKVDGDSLRLNVDTGALGALRASLLDEKGNEIPGFGLAECEPLQTNATGAFARWKSAGNVSTLRGRAVQVRFSGTRSKLYSFRFE